jgi:hypothetical protein
MKDVQYMYLQIVAIWLEAVPSIIYHSQSSMSHESRRDTFPVSISFKSYNGYKCYISSAKMLLKLAYEMCDPKLF